MNKADTKRLIDTFHSQLDTQGKEGKFLRSVVEFVFKEYHDLQERVSDLELELVAVKFDRDCLRQELDNGQPQGITHGELLQSLLESDIDRDQKIAAIKFVRGVTGWGLREAKEWVEQYFFEK